MNGHDTYIYGGNLSEYSVLSKYIEQDFIPRSAIIKTK